MTSNSTKPFGCGCCFLAMPSTLRFLDGSGLLGAPRPRRLWARSCRSRGGLFRRFLGKAKLAKSRRLERQRLVLALTFELEVPLALFGLAEECLSVAPCRTAGRLPAHRCSPE